MKCHDTMILNQCQTPAITPRVCSCLEKKFPKRVNYDLLCPILPFISEPAPTRLSLQSLQWKIHDDLH